MPLRILCLATDEVISNGLPNSSSLISTVVHSMEGARDALGAARFDAVVVQLPVQSGEENFSIKAIRGLAAGLPVIVTGQAIYGPTATKLMEAGADDCVSLAELTAERLQQVLTDLDNTAQSFPGIVGRSLSMRQVFEVTRLIAPRRSTVLITGETGTGKEVVARAVHQHSPRSHRPMVTVNCAAIPETLVEAELFGHTKGAFTGAVGSRVGRFEQANGGTIFLDEVSELPLDVQAKLLRVLQEREIQRLGSSETVSVDVRVIAAANVDLLKAVEQQRFRADLYYRLNVVPIRLPAVREREGDIPLLIEHFVDRFCKQEGLAAKTVAPAAMRRLCDYPWPGNVRQIEHAVEMAVALSGTRSMLTFEDFRLQETRPKSGAVDVVMPSCGIHFDDTVQHLERSLIQQALHISKGNRGRAADLLRLKRTTLLAKIKALGLADASSEAAA